MKKTLLLGLGVIALACGGVAYGLSNRLCAEQVETFAEKTQTSDLYFTGTIAGVNHWGNYGAAENARVRLHKDSESTDLGLIESVTLNRGDVFRFCASTEYAKDCGWSQLRSASDAYFAFADYGEDNNIRVVLDGTYTFWINASKEITVSYADSETYSYVLTSWDDYRNGYIYNSDSDKLTAWDASPAVIGGLRGNQGYDVKFTLSGNDYYGLYKISDRYISTFNYLILKKSGDVSGRYGNQSATISLSGGQKLYYALNGDAEKEYEGEATGNVANTTDAYKAAAFLVDLVTHRGSYTYDSHTFAFSICATSAEDAGKIVTAYDNLDASVRTYLATNCTLNTYDMSKEYGEADANKSRQSISSIVDALRIIVSKSSAGSISGVMQKENNTAIIVTLVAFASASLLAGGFFFLRNKKKSDR